MHAHARGARRGVRGQSRAQDRRLKTAELIVNAERALIEGTKRKQNADARRGAWSPAHELALYLAHGIDHLAGHDDADASGRRSMRRRERQWIRQAESEGLLNVLQEDSSGAHPTERGC